MRDESFMEFNPYAAHFDPLLDSPRKVAQTADIKTKTNKKLKLT